MKAIPKFQFGGVGPIFPTVVPAVVPVGPGLQKPKSRAAVTFTPVIPSMLPQDATWNKGYVNAQQIINEQRKEAATAKLREEWQGGFDKWSKAADTRKSTEAAAKAKGDAALAKAVLDAKKPGATAEDAEIAKGIKDAEKPSGNKSAIPAKAIPAAETTSTKSDATKTASNTNKGKQDSKEVAAIKRIQRSLHVKDDGIWGDKTAAAFEAAKKTQESLGFTGKAVDGIIGADTKKALKALNDELHVNMNAARATKTMISDNQDAIRQPYSRTKKEVRQDLRQIRRNDREERRASRNMEEFNLRTGGILYNCRK